VNAQHLRRQASVGCLVTDGHTVFVLTNRHVCGEPGERISAVTRQGEVEVGTASRRQLTRKEFHTVYPSFAGARTYLNMDVGLVAVDDANQWTSSFYGLGEVGDVVDLNEASIGLQLVERPVVAYGAASGLLEGTVKALFYRYKSVGGFDYVADLLIAPSGKRSTQPGDSGTVWHVGLQDAVPGPLGPGAAGPGAQLHPIAVEWGAQTLDLGGSRWSFALATNLSNVCRLLDVDVVLAHNLGVRPFWGATGHYSIAATAVARTGATSKLGRLLHANADAMSLARSALSHGGIDEGALKKKPFVPLADVPDLVWKQTPWTVTGGRDTSRNIGPEHPNHFCDIDEPGPGNRTLRSSCVADPAEVEVDVWQAYYTANGHAEAASRGCLPFRVWQIFDAMVAFVQQDDFVGYLTAAGVLAHYVGDACQPLHGSYLADGYEDQKVEYTTSGGSKAYRWPGKGVHSAFESVMIDRYAVELFSKLDQQLDAAGAGADPTLPRSGHAAAVATVLLMDRTARKIRPRRLIDRYIALGGGTSKATIDGLWSTFGTATAAVMADGVRVLRSIWRGAWEEGGGLSAAVADLGTVDMALVAARYRSTTFLPSLDLDHIQSVLGP
jgi:hypothetical protein